jgi:hypothetical protein
MEWVGWIDLTKTWLLTLRISVVKSGGGHFSDFYLTCVSINCSISSLNNAVNISHLSFLGVVNAHRLYMLQSGVETMDLLGFRRTIVETYLKKYRSVIPRSVMPASHQSTERRVLADVRFDRLDHWPKMGSRRYALRGCTGTSKFYCEKYNVALHPQ